uniref:hypothetical protein n=1 Tax=Escherichia coli TaxID=562 RepID=UPI00254D7551
MKIKLALLIAFAGFSAGASAEIAEFSFKDTLNVKKTVSPAGTVAKLAMRQPFVLFKGLTFQKLCLPGAFRP